MVVNVLTLTGAGLYAVAWLLYVFGRRGRAHAVLSIGWCVNLAIFVLNWGLAGGPPLGNMYHVNVVLALCFPPLFLLLARRDGMAWAGSYFAFAAAFVLTGAYFMEANVHWRRMPALQSPWFVPHVFAYMVSYSLLAVAFVMTVTKLTRGGDAATRARYTEAARVMVRAAFPLMTFGLLAGAIWAEQAWGRYWAWDPKETWALITWVFYLAYLHCRYDSRTAEWGDAMQALGFAALLWTFLLVNLMPRLSSVLHGYAT